MGDVRQRGLMVGIELVRDRETKEAFGVEEGVGVRVTQAARERGVIIRPLGDVVVLMPPLAIAPAQLRRLVDVVAESIEVVTGEGS